MQCPTVKIKSTDVETQGDYVEINETDFDAEKHELYVEPVPASLAEAAAAEAAAAEKPAKHK